ncbi:MAG: neutral zinc metallopeptidase [Allosphingosinicella sp.]
MRLDDYRMSDNVEEGRSGGGFGFGGGGMGGGIVGLLFGLVLSRFGIVGVLILLLGFCALSTLGGGGDGLGVAGSGPAVAPHQAAASGGAAASCTADAARSLSCRVLASTEDTWGAILGRAGDRYTPTTLHFYSRADDSGCGAAQSAMGPFYCPSDKRIYLDTSFYDELQNRFHAAGDFAQAYVIAHEVGHHIQDLNGTLDQVQERQGALSTKEGNALQVRVELQADCYAGVWAANAKARDGQVLMEAGDLEEGLRAAAAIGDDTLQQQEQGRVVPDAFTHGSSAQRVEWLRRGYQSGDPAACDTFKALGAKT